MKRTEYAVADQRIPPWKGQESKKGVSQLLTPGKLRTENRLPHKHDRRHVSLHDDKRIGGKSVRRTTTDRQRPTDATMVRVSRS